MEQRVCNRFAILFAAVLLIGSAPAPAASPAQVDAAIKKAIRYLYGQQKQGNWEIAQRPNAKGNHVDVDAGQWGGLTAISTCALLYAGESPQDARMKQAIDWLMQAEMYGIYAMGFRCQVWSMIPPNAQIRTVATRDRNYLLSAVYTDGANAGFYPYYFVNGKRGGGGTTWYDHSVSQYGVLGMWAISQLTIETPDAYWRMTEAAWKNHQYPDGSWSYQYGTDVKHRAAATVSMTAAGIATLFITQEMNNPAAGVECRGNYRDEHLARGLAWIGKNFNEFTKVHPHYALYGVERIGVASGYKYFGKLDWYDVGADWFVKGQNGDGSWGRDEKNHNTKKIPNTCFALMFLARGRAPVMMNKLEYAIDTAGDNDRPGSWNQRPRDVANITRWTGKMIERPLNWQIVNLQAPVEDLHDAPILFVGGREPINLKPAEEAKLKAYVEQGGMILGHADCSNLNFAESFRKLGTKLFPQYEFRELPSTHPIFTNELFRRKDWPRQPFLQGLSNGARELMLLFPTTDPGQGWQTFSFSGPIREPLAQVMANIFLYSVDKQNLRFKGETYMLRPDPAAKPTDKVRVARLEYSGNWDPEPAGWRRLGILMRNQDKMDVIVDVVKLGEGKLKSGAYDVAHLTGTASIRLPDAARAELRQFVQGGGTLLIDAAGGISDFALSVDKEISEIFPGKLPAVLPAGHGLYQAGRKLDKFEYRMFARKLLAADSGPRLRGIDFDGKARVFLSAEDLSCGLVGQPCDGIHGYDPSTASAIVQHVLLYAKGKAAKK